DGCPPIRTGKMRWQYLEAGRAARYAPVRDATQSSARGLCMSDDSLLPSVEEGCCRRFEQAWQEGRPLAVEDCLPAPDHPLYLAPLEDLVAIDLDFRARAGQAARVEESLARFPVLNEPGRVARLLREEVGARRRAGEAVTAQDYRGRFPGLGPDALPSTLALP